MKTLYAAIGLAGLFAAGSAQAAGAGPGVLPVPVGQTALFSSFISNNFDFNDIPLHQAINNVQGGGPVSQQFTAPGTETLLGVSFELGAGPANTDGVGGAAPLSVYLVGNGPSNLPASSGITLTSPILLGTISAASIPASITPGSPASGVVTLAINDLITAGTYWIALQTTSTSTSDVWWRTDDQIGLDVGNTGLGSCAPLLNTTCGLFNAHVSGVPGPTLGNEFQNNGTGAESQEMQLDVAAVPEPASLALLGAGLAGLGFIRRRRANKSAG